MSGPRAVGADRRGGEAPRKLLAIDGGGVRGLLAIEILAALERRLQHELRRGDDFVLAEYFDYVAGTSVGAVFAACIALGMRIDHIRALAHASVNLLFTPAGPWQRFRHRYTASRFTSLLQREIGRDTLLGSDRLRTLLMVVMRNATTDSPWPITNNPHAMFNQPDLPDCNLNLPLWALVRASTAAPTYFPPEVIDLGGRRFVFVDGGMTVYNNPAYLLFLMATAGPYRLCWPAGENRLLLVSVGTGSQPHTERDLHPGKMHLLYHARAVPLGLMSAAAAQQDLLCRVLGRCRVGDPIDMEVGDFIHATSPVEPRLFTYLRYNADLSPDGLRRLGLPALASPGLAQLDAVRHVATLRQVGEAAGRKVGPEHFAGFLSS